MSRLSLPSDLSSNTEQTKISTNSRIDICLSDDPQSPRIRSAFTGGVILIGAGGRKHVEVCGGRATNGYADVQARD